MTVEQRILERIRKLLALSSSSNPNEAAAAAAAAQRLMLEHRIESIEMGVQPGEVHREHYGTRERRASPWRDLVLSALAYANSCRVIRERDGSPDGHQRWIIGRTEDMAAVRYLDQYVCNEVDRLCAEESGRHDRVMCYRPTRAESNAFKLGCADTIAKRIRAERDRISIKRAPGAALAKLEVTRELAQQIMECKLEPEPVPEVVETAAFHRGRAAGKQVQLSGGRALGRGTNGSLT